MSEHKTDLESAIAAADRGSISIGGPYERLPLASWLPGGRAVLKILEDAKAVIAERDGLRDASAPIVDRLQPYGSAMDGKTQQSVNRGSVAGRTLEDEVATLRKALEGLT